MELRLETVALLALPASGKSEVRRYLEHLDPSAAARDMALGPTVQLDDYPYVHLMRRISQELTRLDQNPVFFQSDESPWADPLDWITLIHLLNEDYLALITAGRTPPSPAEILDRFDAARERAGASPPFSSMAKNTHRALTKAITQDVASIPPLAPSVEGSTVVIEFARGGPEGAELPLPYPFGYAASLAALHPRILEELSILYVWVEPNESRRRNRERAIGGIGGDASILHHGVPEAVMRADYGTDDMKWLADQARVPGTIPIGSVDIPMEVFDNRADRTSFLRSDPSQWPPPAVATLHEDLSETLSLLAHHRHFAG